MSWTEAQYDKVAAYLGYPITSDYLVKVTQKMDAITALSASAETRVASYLTELAAIETQIATARNSPGSALGQLKAEARRFTKLVSFGLNLEVHEDVW